MYKLHRSHFIFLAGFALMAFGILLLTGSGRPKTTDEYMVFFQAESFWGDGNFSVPQAPLVFHHWYGKLGLDSRPYAPYGILHALFLSPLVGLGKIFFGLSGLTQDKWILAGPFIPSLFSSLAMVLSACLLGVMALKKGLRPEYILLLQASFLFATPLAAYGGTLFSEPFSALLWMSVLLILFFLRNQEENIPGTFFYLGGIAAMTVWIRPNQVIYLPIIFAAAVWMMPRKNFREPLLFAIASAAIVCALLLYNKMTYGAFLDFGYPALAETGKELNKFDRPLWQGLYVLMASPGKSFLLYAPVSVLALAQIRQLKQNSFAGIFLAVLSVYLVFFGSFSGVEGGYCFGPRFFLNLIPFVYVALLPAFKEPSKKFISWFAALTVLGVIVNFSGLCISFLEEQVDHHYYGQGFVYQLFHADSWGQWKLLFHYLQLTWNGGYGSAALGTGWDMGVVFLAKAGVSPFLWKSILVFGLTALALGLGLILTCFKGLQEKASQKEVFQ